MNLVSASETIRNEITQLKSERYNLLASTETIRNEISEMRIQRDTYGNSVYSLVNEYETIRNETMKMNSEKDTIRLLLAELSRGYRSEVTFKVGFFNIMILFID